MAQSDGDRIPEFMNLVRNDGQPASARVVAERTVLALNESMILLYEASLAKFKQNMRERVPIILALFTGEGSSSSACTRDSPPWTHSARMKYSPTCRTRPTAPAHRPDLRRRGPPGCAAGARRSLGRKVRRGRAPGHFYDDLASYGAQPTEQRVVTSGRIVTGAGVSAGIDLALTLAANIAGPELAQGIQLAIEYDPHPPFDAGAPSKAPKPIVEMAVAALGD